MPAPDLSTITLGDPESEARRRGYELIQLDAFADLEGREATIAAAEERGREVYPLVRTLGDLAGRELPSAAERVMELSAENAELRQRIAQLGRDFTFVVESLLLAEFPEHCGR
jgi:hypothetical protein